MKHYILADRLLVPILRQQLLLQIVNPREFQQFPFRSVIKLAFKNLPASDPVLAFLVDGSTKHMLSEGIVSRLENQWEELPPRFTYRCFEKLVDIRRNDTALVDNLDPCEYHEHDSTDDRPYCRLRYKNHEYLNWSGESMV